MAGRDIRRVVAQAALTSAPEKLMVIRRVRAGLAAKPRVRMLMIDDVQGYGRFVAEEKGDVPVELIPDPAPLEREAPVTTAWVSALEAEGAQAIVVIGGDGTQRAAALAAPRVPLLPLAGGTNNVACWTGDQTAAGMAAVEVAARGEAGGHGTMRAKLLHITTSEGQQDSAMIDVAHIRKAYTGALAVWKSGEVSELVLAIADPVRPGLSNIGGVLEAVDFEDDAGLWVQLDPAEERTSFPAVLAPGLLGRFSVRRIERLAMGQAVSMRGLAERSSLALDGERTLVLKPHERATVTVARDGPWTIYPPWVFTTSRPSATVFIPKA